MSERSRPSHPEQPPSEPRGPTKTADYRYRFRGNFDREAEGTCRVRILEERDRPPVMVLTELNANASTSVTNCVEILAAELIAKHFPHRFEVVGEDPVTLIEHYEPSPTVNGKRRRDATYDRVVFERWVPRRIWLHGQARLSFETPDWRHLPDNEVREILGEEADDLP